MTIFAENFISLYIAYVLLVCPANNHFILDCFKTKFHANPRSAVHATSKRTVAFNVVSYNVDCFPKQCQRFVIFLLFFVYKLWSLQPALLEMLHCVARHFCILTAIISQKIVKRWINYYKILMILEIKSTYWLKNWHSASWLRLSKTKFFPLMQFQIMRMLGLV